MPPGYIDPPALVQFLADLRGLVEGPRPSDAAAAVWKRSPLIGSPATVRERLLAYVEELGLGTVLALLQFGSLPAELTARSTRLYATEVVPYVREHADKHFAAQGWACPRGGRGAGVDMTEVRELDPTRATLEVWGRDVT